jgi:single-stranded-DNA-specific exonuclease
MVWQKYPIESDTVRKVSEEFGIDLLLASILVRRNLHRREDIKFVLEDDLLFTHNPFLFVEMEDAVDRIHQALEEGEKILIFGDRDVDGITSTVLLTQAIRDLGGDVRWQVPMGDDPYGLNMEAVERFAADDGTLIITVDCGISNKQEIERALELGIETLVVDHHNPPEELPPAVAIINPKVEDCGYPFRDLAGCGVASKLVWALLFSRSPFYNQSVCLLNVRPGNDSYFIEAVKLINLVETDRVVETLNPGMVGLAETRLYRFLEGEEILVYDADPQEKMLRKIFGPDTLIALIDLKPEIEQVFPALRGRGTSLLALREKSRIGRYESSRLEEIDVLANLFRSFVHRKVPALNEDFPRCLDLVALGTLADLMPLVDENRILVRQGLKVLNATGRKGLRELLFQKNLLGKRIGTTDIAWQLSPSINATGRLGRPDTAVNLLLSEDEKQLKELAEEVDSLNRERKKLGETVWSRILPKTKKNLDEMSGNMVFISDSSIHRGITGIIASRLSNTMKVPAVVVAHFDGKAVGSVRCDPPFNVRSFLSNFEDLFFDYGGHDCAGGFSMPEEHFDTFTHRVRTFAKGIEPVETVEERLSIDAELPPAYMKPELITVQESFEPYGEANPPLIFLARGMKILQADLMGRKEVVHLKLLLEGGVHKWPAVYWNAAPRLGRDFQVGDCVDVAFRLGRNYYNNNETLQLTVLDLHRPEDVQLVEESVAE